MQVGSANRRQRDPDHCFANAGARPVNFFYTDIILAVKYSRFHFCHEIDPLCGGKYSAHPLFHTTRVVLMTSTRVKYIVSITSNQQM